MPYGKRNVKRRPAYRVKKTYRKKTYKKARRYAPNNLNAVVIKPTLMPRLLYVKLLHTGVADGVTVNTGSSIRRVWLGNSSAPFPTNNANALGAYGTIPVNCAATETYPPGFYEYSRMYDKYMIPASKLDLEVQFPATTSGVHLRVVLVPIGPNPSSTPDDYLSNMINELDAYDYTQLSGYPQAITRQILPGSSGYGICRIKCARKTKHMLAIKDLADHQDLICDTPNSTLFDGQRPIDSNSMLWGFYVRIFNLHTVNVTINYNAKLTQMYRFSNRKYLSFTSSAGITP